MSTQGRQAVSLTDEEVDAFLGEHTKVQVATVGPDGAPHLTTLFYVIDHGRIAFWTYGASQKIVNLRRDPRLSCLVEDGEDYVELRGVSISGRATLVEEYDEVRALGAKVFAAMTGAADGEPGERLAEGLVDDLVAKQARKRVGVIVEPVHIASWDHRKMFARPPGG